MNIREKYGIPEEAKILLYVGNISRNKNQEQMIRGYNNLSEALCEQTYILFLGRNIENDYCLEEFVSNSQYRDHLIICGNIDKEIIPSYYKQCDGVVLLSIVEGFGLSLIEGMHFGKPSMTFTDLDAYEDIYNEKAVIGIQERSDESVAKGLEQLLTSEWDATEIKDYSAKFEANAMANNYINCFKKIITQ